MLLMISPTNFQGTPDDRFAALGVRVLAAKPPVVRQTRARVTTTARLEKTRKSVWDYL